jgi:hypothetical protein
MKEKPINPELLNKVKDGLIKSGFPLELRMAKIIEEKGWNYTIASHYLDFETNKLRESDIIADKIINGTEIYLMIECKKSDDKQLILYQPKKQTKGHFSILRTKCFPELDVEDDYYLIEHLSRLFKKLPVLSTQHQFSNSIIFSKGNQIEQNNVSFFSSINSIVKRSITHYRKSKSRRFYIYIIIYDGYILKLTYGKDKETSFDLVEIDYGQYSIDILFDKPKENLVVDIENIQAFGSNFIVEIMKPSFFSIYLDHIESVLRNVNKNELNGWGEESEDLPF